jgi:hypothetical protein
VLWNAFNRIAAGAFAQKKQALYSGTARLSTGLKLSRHAREHEAGRIDALLQPADEQTLDIAERFLHY